MSCSLPPMAFVLALISCAVGANIPYLQEPGFMLVRDGGGHVQSSTTASSTTTSSSRTTSSRMTSSATSSSTTSSSRMSSTSTSSGSEYHTSTTYTSNTQSTSSFTTTTTGTFTSSSSAYTSSTSNTSSSSAQNNQDSSTSTASQGLSTAARTGLSFGIMFFLIFSAILFCYLRRRSRKARENASYRSALPPEVRQHRPPDLTASTERELPPPPRLDTTYLNPSDISHFPFPSAISSVDPLLGNGSRPNSESISAWSRHSALSQVTDVPQIATQQMSALPNPHDPFSAPVRSASYASTTASHSRPYDASIIGNVAMASAFVAPGAGSSSNSQPQQRLSALHKDLARHQKELELDHGKQGVDAQEEPQDPPPEYSS